VEPGPINTHFGDNSVEKLRDLDVDTSHFGGEYRTQDQRLDARRERQSAFMLPPEAAAKKIVKALESGRPASRYKVTVPAYIGAAIRRLAPDWLVDRVFIEIWKKRAKNETHFKT